ncbi:MAG: response regulator transcription factor [Candidatus Kapaibacterium sp.]|nr:response regulator transcription factor [Ignavibacteriota bacterium]MCB9221739.1 response regulator transcription factor [Ignavibacteria bacterium]
MRVLIIEDEIKIASFMKNGLKQERYEVDLETNGRDGLELAMNTQYDLILLDVMLPGINGIEILKELRANNYNVPVILISALDSTEDRVNGLDFGADDYISKPFSFDELAARIRAILRRTQKHKSTKLHAGELTLDTVTHLAYRDNKEIELTTKEYSLLMFLMINKNKVLTRNSITQNVWGEDLDKDSNVIDVYIKKLRSKIEKKGTRPTIQSIRSVGYRLRDDSALEEFKNNEN